MRLLGLALLLACMTLLGIGRWLTPAPGEMGSHQGLGLPACGFYDWTGIPCPTCGCTTAVTWLAHGHPLKAFLIQPFGALVGLAALGGALLGLWMLLLGHWPGPGLFWFQWHLGRLLRGLGGLLLLGWVYRILRCRWQA